MKYTMLSVGAVIALSGAAFADVSDPAMTFLATNSLGQSASYTVSLEDGDFDGDGNWFWSSFDAIQMRDDSGNLVATINRGSMYYEADPIIAMGFVVQAGNSDTSFTITSGLLSFPTISSPLARASGGVTLTDVTGGGATLTGDQPGGNMFSSFYNGFLGTTFADILTGPLVEGDDFGTADMTDEFPGGGSFNAVGTPISDMSSQWAFTLSAKDSASGTSVYVIVPTPAGVALLGVGVMGIVRRRR